jgi:hypothetical protein
MCRFYQGRGGQEKVQEAGDGVHLHLHKDLTAVSIDSPHADTQGSSNLFGRPSAGQQVQHFPLTRGQPCESRCQYCALRFNFPGPPIKLDGLLNAVEELVRGKRFSEDVDRSLLHGADRNGDVAVARDTAQAYVEHEASRSRWVEGTEKLFS